MPGRFARSFELAKASWSVVKADKELLLLPVMSVAACTSNRRAASSAGPFSAAISGRSASRSR